MPRDAGDAAAAGLPAGRAAARHAQGAVQRGQRAAATTGARPRPRALGAAGVAEPPPRPAALLPRPRGRRGHLARADRAAGAATALLGPTAAGKSAFVQGGVN